MRRLFQGQPSVNADNAQACCIVVLARNGNARWLRRANRENRTDERKETRRCPLLSQAYTIRKFLTFIAVAGGTTGVITTVGFPRIFLCATEGLRRGDRGGHDSRDKD